MGRFESWKKKAKALQREIFALYLAYRDPRVPWYAKLLILAVVGYAFSPIDLIPDFIPILGYLDDLILLPVGVTLAIKLIPAEVMSECRVKAQIQGMEVKPRIWIVALLILGLWALVLTWIVLHVF